MFPPYDAPNSEPDDAASPHDRGASPPESDTEWSRTREAILTRFVAWLDTAAETEAGREQLRKFEQASRNERRSSEHRPQVGPSQHVTGEEGRREQAAASVDGLSGLLDIVGHLTALRHEIKLQTKSNRALAERVDAGAGRFEASAEQITRTLERLPDIDAPQIIRPLAESLVDVDEAVGRLREAIDALADEWPAAPPPPPAVSWWGRSAVATAWRALTEPWQQRHRRIAGLADGVRLLASRLERHLDDHHIERIGRIGETVDPHAMQVLEVITDAEAASGTVVRVLRPGYRRGNTILRAAQVAAAGHSS